LYEAALELFHQIKEHGYAKIDEMLTSKQEENVHLDFKEKQNPTSATLSDDDKKNIRKAVSGFANVAGGVVIWGIRTGKNEFDYAENLAPITNHRGFMANMNSYIPQSALPINPGIQSYAIDDLSNTEKGFVVLFIPFSDRPVRTEGTGDKQFYKRVTDNFFPLSVYDIEEMYGRRQGAVLLPMLRFKKGGSSQNAMGIMFNSKVEFGIRNIGRGVAKFPFLTMENVLGMQKNRNGTSGNGPSDLHQSPANLSHYFGGSDLVIHPGMEFYGPAYDLAVQTTLQRFPNLGNGLRFSACFTFGCEGQLAKRAKIEMEEVDVIDLFTSPRSIQIASTEMAFP
jgi:hypothetical protein